jgi:hypothetical protein
MIPIWYDKLSLSKTFPRFARKRPTLLVACGKNRFSLLVHRFGSTSAFWARGSVS